MEAPLKISKENTQQETAEGLTTTMALSPECLTGIGEVTALGLQRLEHSESIDGP